MRFINFHRTALALTFLAVALLLGVQPAAWSQTTSGDIVGTVLDNTGAAIANAKVTAKNIATGVTTTVDTNKTGDYHIANLLPGTYNISGSAAGFATYTLKNFAVALNSTGTAKLVLPVASSNTVVEVSADASAVIDTTTTQLETSFSTEALQNLPTASTGLGVLNLSLLVPGVASSGGVGAGTGPSVGGLRPEDNNYTIEGIDNNDKSVTGPLVYVPNDAVGDFTVIVNQFSPEFGHSAGGQFNTTIKSGTNKIHGEAYEYNVNRNYNAENAIQGGKVPNPRYDFNRYGGQVGGPVIKNKLFYFANFERQTTGQSGQYYVCTPTAAGMTTLADPSLNFDATNLAIFNKYTPVAPSQVDYNSDNACFNQSSGNQFLTVYSDTAYNSNGPSYAGNFGVGDYGTANPTDIPLGNVLISAPNYSNFDALTSSADWTISTKDSFRGRYIFNKQTGIDTAAGLPEFYQPIPYRFHLIALSEYHTFTPNLLNEARIGFNRFYNATPSGNYTWPGLDSFPTTYMYDAGFLSIGPDGNAPQSTVQNLYQFVDNLSWVKGKHSFKFGFDGRKFISPQSFTQRQRGDYEWYYLTEYMHDLTPTAFAERSTGNFFYYGDQTAFYGYANDTYRLTDKLSLNYGIRYEFTSVPVGERVQSLNAAASVPGLIDFSTPQPQYKNFVPRVGVNYAMSPNTSIRAGFGMAYDVIFDNLGILSFPPQYSQTNDVDTTENPVPLFNQAGYPNFLANGGLPHGSGSAYVFPSTPDGLAAQRAATAAYVPNQTLPYAENWTLGVQHVFHSDYTAEVRYVGTRGIHLPTQIQLNIQPRVNAANQLKTYFQAPSTSELSQLTNTLHAIQTVPTKNYVPAFFNAGFTSKITSFQPASESNYNGLEASLKRNFKNGLLLNFAYTYSKAMDDATAAVFSTVLTPRRPQNSQDVAADYSRSALDRTHRFTAYFVYDLPFFKQSTWMMKNLVGNWEISPIYTYESPEYFTVLSGVNSNQNGDSGAIDRTIINPAGAKHVGTGVLAYANPTLAGNCDPATTATDPNGVILCSADEVAYVAKSSDAEYVTAGAGTLPTGSRNTEPISPINNLDATATKRFNFTERYALEFSAGAFNVLNHAQYMPGTIDNINSPGYTAQTNFQTASNANFNKPGKFFAANARTMQLNLKFVF
jgi:outer membrane receptor protein involved in Fe transport